jgi:hypothetical protein
MMLREFITAGIVMLISSVISANMESDTQRTRGTAKANPATTRPKAALRTREKFCYSSYWGSNFVNRR